MSELEKKTLWKIQDCETLLHKRINSDFVESACKSVYERVIKEVYYINIINRWRE